MSSGVELDDNKVKTVTIYGNDLTRSFYLAYKGELNDVEDDFVRYISTQGQEVVSEKYTAVAKPGSFLSDKAGGEIKYWRFYISDTTCKGTGRQIYGDKSKC